MPVAFIIFGTRGVTYTKDKGRFHCPQCDSYRDHKHKRVRRFFTLYFIPVIPLDLLGEYIECQACRGTFQLEILDYDPAEEQRQVEAQFHGAMRDVMARMSIADGRIDDAEVRAIIQIYRDLSGSEISAEQVREECEAVKNSRTNLHDAVQRLRGALNEHGKEMVIRSAFLVAAADGVIADEEKVLLQNIADALDLSSAHFRGILAELMEEAERG